MKISQTEIIKIIKNPTFYQISKTKRSCPSPIKLTALMRLELSDRKRSKVIDHIEDCSSCTHEIKFINEILTEEQNFDKEVTQIVMRQNQTSQNKGIHIKSPFPKLSWSLKSVAALMMTIVLSTSVFFLLKTNKPAIERNSILQLNQISPKDTSLNLSELIFQWERIADSEYYTIEIFDDSLVPVWESKKITENRVIPSTELKGLLKPKTTYLWMVTSFSKNGKLVESPLATFNLK